MSEVSFPEHWKTEKLGQLCRVFSGYGFKTKDYTEEGIPLIKIGNLQDGEVVINPDNNYMPESWQENEKLQKFILKSRDILIALTGATTGKTAVVPPSLAGAFLNQRVGKIELISPDANQDFILAVIKARFFQQVIQQNILRSAQGNISPSSIAQIPIPLPPLPEQRAIARILQTIQEAKSARQRELALERERKAALMDYLFSHGTKGEPRKQTEIGEIPESWEVVELGNHSELITKGSSPKWQGFDYCDEGIYFVRSQNVGSGRLELNEIAYLPGEFNEKEKKSILKKNDLLINIVGASIGRAAVADDIIEGGNVNQAVAISRLKQGVEPLFVMTFLLTLGGQFQLHKQKKDIARANLSLQDIKNLIIPLPCVSDQTEIIEILQACDTKIAALEGEVARLDELFHAMLDELMTGKRSAVPLIDTQISH